MTGPEEKDSEITGGRKKCMRQEEERFFQIIFEKNSHVLFRYICGQLNNDRETAKDVLNDVWEVLVVKFETIADLEGRNGCSVWQKTRSRISAENIIIRMKFPIHSIRKRTEMKGRRPRQPRLRNEW